MALNLGMLGMKMETLIQTETVSENMVTLLKNSVPQRHQAVLDVADQRIAVHWEEALSSDGRMPNMERDLFQSIYNVVLKSFHQNGGDAMAGNRVAFWKRSHCKDRASIRRVCGSIPQIEGGKSGFLRLAVHPRHPTGLSGHVYSMRPWVLSAPRF